MKVLFAVSNENITTSVISKYQQKYKEIVTSKSVYYFNAIIKELQNDRSYDAIVIGEDLEPISNNNYDVIDKFIIEKLDSISDEASKTTGEDIPIIFICSDRRTKSDQLLRNLFSMGIYNALVGNDRSLDNVCSLMNKPRSKKEAKKYYMIEGDDSIEYEPTNDELVSEEQLRNILTYYKKIGNDERKCVQAFESISQQYNNAQLRLIVKILPIEVKAILESKSPIYQKLMENGTVLSDGRYSPYSQNNPKKPAKLDFIEKNISTNKMTKPVIIPSNINFSNEKKNMPDKNNNTGFSSINSQPRYTNDVNNYGKRIEQQNVQSSRQQYNPYFNPYNNSYNNIRQQQNLNQGYIQYQSRYGTIPPYNPYNSNQYLSNYENFNGNKNGIYQSSVKPTMGNISSENSINNANLISNQANQSNRNIQNNQENLSNNQNNINNNEDNQNTKSIKDHQYIKDDQNFEKNDEKKEEDIFLSHIDSQNEVATPIKRKRGRPRKNIEQENNIQSDTVLKRKRGRPKKVENLENPPEDEKMKSNSQNMDRVAQNENINSAESLINNAENVNDVGSINSVQNVNSLKNIGEEKTRPTEKNNDIDLFNLSIDVPEENANNNETNKENSNAEEDKYAFLNTNSSSNLNKNEGFNNPYSVSDSKFSNIINEQNDNRLNDDINGRFTTGLNDNSNRMLNNNEALIKNYDINSNENNNFVIAGNGKIVSFVGASKNGTSFIVNSLGILLANDGIKVAIVDFTKNKNSYYLFTDNDSDKVKIAADSLKKLSNGVIDGLKIKDDLYLFTSVPDENIDEKLNKNKILNTLSENFDIVMLDCDLQSDAAYFSNSDEIYLIQSMDVFTIQPLTKFLSDYKDIIDVNKLHAVINKYLKLKKLDYKMVIAGMSKYNDPSMALQRDLFDAKKISCNLIPFDIKTYSSYLEAIALCKINLNEFSNDVIDSLYELKSKVYPLVDQHGENKISEQRRMTNKNMNNANYVMPNSNIYNKSFEQNYGESDYFNVEKDRKENVNENLSNSTFSNNINSILNKMRKNNF